MATSAQYEKIVNNQVLSASIKKIAATGKLTKKQIASILKQGAIKRKMNLSSEEAFMLVDAIIPNYG